jgi:4-alpha-glucanotransferase
MRSKQLSESETTEPGLARRAAAHGIETDYETIWGHRRAVEESTLRALLEAIGAGADEGSRSAGEPLLAPLVVDLAEAGSALAEFLGSLQLPGDTPVELDWEDGTASVLRLGEPEAAKSFRPGYHWIRVRTAAAELRRRLIVAPAECYTPADGRPRNGIHCFLPALRSARNWGAGDLTDLVEFAGRLREQAPFDFIALNPLHAIHNRAPYNTSPYLPLSIFTRNDLYLDVEACPEFAESAAARKLFASAPVQAILVSLREASYIDYEKVARLKHLFLLLLYRQYLRGDQSELEQYRRERGHWLENYCLYRALDRHWHGRDATLWHWRQWPEPYQSPDTAASREFAGRQGRKLGFYAYVEWRLEQQLEAAQAHIRALGYSIGLYQDLALATDRVGADHWAYQGLFAAGVRVGSPPDDFNENGQDWGFPALHPDRHALDGYRYFVESVRCAARHAGAIRLDHVMRLARLYWIPDGSSARQGAYVRDHFEVLLRLLALESQRGRFLVIGEDLGTVPAYFREALGRRRIFSYRLILFEREHGAFRPAGHYPVGAIASFTTHDLPTLAGWLAGRDLDCRREAGQLTAEAAEQARQGRQPEVELLRRAFSVRDRRNDYDVFYPGLVEFLAATPCRLRLLNLEEVYAEERQQNLPGTTSEAPNWQQRLPLELAQFFAEPGVTRRLRIWKEAMQ